MFPAAAQSFLSDDDRDQDSKLNDFATPHESIQVTEPERFSMACSYRTTWAMSETGAY